MHNQDTSLSEEALTYLESLIPDLTAQASRQAYVAALAAGNSVVILAGRQLVEVFPDGSRRVVKDLPPALPVTVPQTIFIA